MQWVMYVSCSLSRNLDGELTALVQRSCCWDGGRNLLDTMRSVEVGVSKNRKISLCGEYSKDNVKTSETLVLKYGNRC